MLRKIIQINNQKCNGCGACANACHEGAIAIIGGKATLIRDDYCDGFGDCLPTCPTGAISFIEREAAPYDEAAVNARKARKNAESGGCPGLKMRDMQQSPCPLSQWPCQLKLAPVTAPYFNGAKLLIAADCTAFAYSDIHNRFMRGFITLIGCPKLDAVDYSEKLSQIIKNNDILEIVVLRMEVPCCGGLELALKKAVTASGKNIPVTVTTISIDGKIL